MSLLSIDDFDCIGGLRLHHPQNFQNKKSKSRNKSSELQGAGHTRLKFSTKTGNSDLTVDYTIAPSTHSFWHLLAFSLSIDQSKSNKSKSFILEPSFY